MKLPLQLPYPEAATVCDAKGRAVAECVDNETARAIVEAMNQIAALHWTADTAWLAYNTDGDLSRAMHSLGEALSHWYSDGTPRVKE